MENNNSIKGKVVIPFLESVAEESKPAVEKFVASTGITSEEIANFKTFDEFLSAYKPKTQSGDWISTLPEEQRAVVGIKGWKTPSDMLKSYNEVEKLVGLEKIAMPRKDKSGSYKKGELERVLTQLGAPKEAKDYMLSANFKSPEGLEIDEQEMANFKEASHKLGLLPHQFAGLMDYFTAYLGRGLEAQKKTNETSFNEANLNLRTKWGSTYDEKVKLANMILRSFVEDRTQSEAIVKKYGNDSVIIELLANIGDNLSEDSLVKKGMSGLLLTPNAAQVEINKIKSDSKHPYLNAGHPDHQYWVNRMAELYKLANP